jgi:hypothetical protein
MSLLSSINPFHKRLALHKSYCNHAIKANQRNILFELSFKRFCQLKATKYCYYTGVRLTTENGKSQLTFDRVDNSIGYTDSNTVACCESFNHRKTNLTVAEIIAMYNGIKRKGLI